MGLRYYIAIDLKSFYASVECVERGLDPLSAYLLDGAAYGEVLHQMILHRV